MSSKGSFADQTRVRAAARRTIDVSCAKTHQTRVWTDLYIGMNSRERPGPADFESVQFAAGLPIRLFVLSSKSVAGIMFLWSILDWFTSSMMMKACAAALERFCDLPAS